MKVFLIDERPLSDHGEAFCDVLSDQLRDAGHEVVGPWSLPPQRGAWSMKVPMRQEPWFPAWKAVSASLAEGNYRQIAAADVVICLGYATIGPVVGAAMGYAHALSKVMFVYVTGSTFSWVVEPAFDVHAEFLCDGTGGMVTGSIAAIVRSLDMLVARRKAEGCAST